ncbi:fibronectin type III domain-containing protein [Herbaspirillum huttiense]|uniref:fibronectin type III domain-containing protein n=1 Tax=Herbaspirillum huttiense TaxID=863372 RepID=UPI003822177B
MSFPVKGTSLTLDLIDSGSSVLAVVPKGLIYTTLQWSRVDSNGVATDIASPAGTANPYVKTTADRGYDLAARATGVSIGGRKSITVPFQKPGAPVIGTTSGGDQQASFTFSAPADDGGKAITAYTLYVYKKADDTLLGSVSGASSPLVKTGLTNGTQVYGKVTATNAIGEGAASGASTLVTPNPVATVAPVFTAGPALSTTPQVGVAMTVVPGTLNDSTATTSTYDILRSGRIVASGSNPSYTPSAKDLGHYFACRHHVVNALGSDDAGCMPAICTAATAATLAFTKLPYCHASNPVVGEPVMFAPATAQGTGVTITYQGILNGVLQGSAAATPPVLTPSATGTVAMRTIISNASGTLTYDTDPVTVSAAVAATGVWRWASAFNRNCLFQWTNSTGVANKLMANDEHAVGSGGITSFKLSFDNVISGGLVAPTGPGSATTLEDVYAVVFINGVRQGNPVRVTWDGGSIGKVFADGAVNVMSDEVPATAFGLSVIPQGAIINLQPRWDWPAGKVMPCQEIATSAVRGSFFYYDPTTATIGAGIGSTSYQGGYVLVSGTGMSYNGPRGPKLAILGKFFSGDPKVLFGLGDSTFGSNGYASIFHNVVANEPGRPYLASFNCQRSGGTSSFFAAGTGGAGDITQLVKYANVVLDGIHINSITGTAANSTDIKNRSLVYWPIMRAAFQTGPGLRTGKIIRNGFTMRLSTYTATNALSSAQAPTSRMGLGGDIVTDWDVWVQTKVSDGTIDVVNEIRSLYGLTGDITKVNAFKTMPGNFSDGLHMGHGEYIGYKSREVVEAL